MNKITGIHCLKKPEIKCVLYSIYNLDGKIEINKLHNAKIVGKTLFISQLQDHEAFLNEYSFKYSYNIPFDKEIPESGKNKQKFNTRITYKGSRNNQTFDQICYTHLAFHHKIINSFNFNRLWIQQSSNIMWIINVLVALLAIFAAFNAYK